MVQKKKMPAKRNGNKARDKGYVKEYKRETGKQAERQTGKEVEEAEREIWKPGNMLYPLPVIMVSCKRDLERPNIITLAWAGTINSDPAMVSISVRKERYSYSILKESKEFVINLVNKELIYATDFCGVRSGKEYDKFQEMNLTAIPSKTIAAPGIKESPVNIECKVEQVIPLGSHDLFIARVTAVAVDGKYMDDKGKFDLNSSGLVAYSHGEYFELGKRLGKFGYSVKKTSRKRN